MVTPKKYRDREMAAGEFKARCLKVMDEVAQYRRSVTITKHGKPIARLVPLETEEADQPASIFGCMTGKVEIVGDVETSPLPWKEWKVFRDDAGSHE